MRGVRLSVVAASLALLIGVASAESTMDSRPPKTDQEPPASQFERVGGEDAATAVVISSLPFVDTGTTCGYIDDYDVECPYSGSAPDVVYKYVPPVDIVVSVDLCDSFYDTKVYVFEDEALSVNAIACSDDNLQCVDPPVSYTSWIETVTLEALRTYYIVVDGYGTYCGDYVLAVEEYEPCLEIECPAGAIAESSDPNGGCGDNPPAFQELAPSDEMIAVCGNVTCDGMSRDTDWYLLDVAGLNVPITICVEALFPVMVGFVDLREGCEGGIGLYSFATEVPCESACVTEALPAGDWCVFISTNDFPIVPVEQSDYTLTVTGYVPSVPVESTSWSMIKSIFR